MFFGGHLFLSSPHTLAVSKVEEDSGVTYKIISVVFHIQNFQNVERNKIFQFANIKLQSIYLKYSENYFGI